MLFKRTDTYFRKHDGHTIEFRRPTLEDSTSDSEIYAELIKAEKEEAGLDTKRGLYERMAAKLVDRIISIDGVSSDLKEPADIIPVVTPMELGILFGMMMAGGDGLTMVTDDEKKP